MKQIHCFFRSIFLIIIFLLSSFPTPEHAQTGTSHFGMRRYTTKDYETRAHYFPRGATRYEVTQKTHCTDLTVAGYKVWGVGSWNPIDYVEIEKKVLYGPNPRKPLPYLYLVEIQEHNITRIKVRTEFAHIPRHQEKRNIHVRWIIATGPVFTEQTKEQSIYAILRKSRIRPWDYAARNAMFISKDGTAFALVSHYGTVWDVIQLLHRYHKDYFYLVMFDGGSASSPHAVNPVWITVHKKK